MKRLVKITHAVKVLMALLLFLAYSVASASLSIAAEPEITSPANNATLVGLSFTFEWTANDAVVEEWWLYIGSSEGQNDIANSGSLGLVTAYIANVPASGNTVYVRLWYKEAGIWKFVENTYIADNTGAGLPVITSPVTQSTLSGTSITFTWTANGADVTEWWLYAGSDAGMNDYNDSGSLGVATSYLLNSLPAGSAPIYVRLWYREGGIWRYIDNTYTGVDTIVELPEIISPVPGSALPASTTFNWSSNGTGVSMWWMYVGSSIGAADIVNTGSLGTVTSHAINGLPDDGSIVYVRLWYREGGVWYSVDNTYTAGMVELPFQITVRTGNPGASSDLQFEIPTFAFGGGYNYSVDCDNDGIIEATGVSGNYLCSYSVAGDYTVSISGAFPRIYFIGSSDNRKLLSVDQWGTGQWRSMYGAFHGCENMILSATDTPNLTSVSNMSGMFRGASSFNQDISSWDIAAVRNMDLLFKGASSFNQELGNWDVSAITSMGGMFSGASSFNQDISNWDVSSVTTMQHMFSNANSFNQDISNWDVHSVTHMGSMFWTNIGDSIFNQDIGGWDVGAVTDMRGMFFSASSFNQDIGSWNVSAVTDMDYMFFSASSFNQDIGNWDVSAANAMLEMFSGVTLSVDNYDSLLNGWSQQALQAAVTFSGGRSQYSSAGSAARQSIIDNFGWSIVDYGLQQ